MHTGRQIPEPIRLENPFLPKCAQLTVIHFRKTAGTCWHAWLAVMKHVKNVNTAAGANPGLSACTSAGNKGHFGGAVTLVPAHSPDDTAVTLQTGRAREIMTG